LPADFNSIQEAINEAYTGDQIVVAPETYNEAIDFKGKAIGLYSSGGPEVTTIDGTGHYHVVQCISGENAGTVLEGFTITGGNANDLFYTAHRIGGGMLNNGSSPTVTDCNFSNNSASTNGGGMYCDSSSPTVTDCTFSDNTAGDWGGGMCNANASTPTVTECNFTHNSASDGGGLFNVASNPIVTKCTFTDNPAGLGGGMYNYDGSSPTVSNCTFTDNAASSDTYGGGGMFNNTSSNPIVTNCTFTGNTAETHGSGMYNSNSSPTVTNCILWGDWGCPDEIYDGGTSTTTVDYSDVQGGWLGTGGDNIDADPVFLDAIGGDLRLCWTSPCYRRRRQQCTGPAGDRPGG